MPYAPMMHDVDPKKRILDEVGDISKFEVFHNQILVAVYIRPQKTKSGIYLSDKTTDEDRFQSKVGLVIAKGSDAFQDSAGEWFKDATIEMHDWVVFRPSDGWNVTVNGVLCRMMQDTQVRARVAHPDMAY
jgi:co-chaperonin GroES (HSP10)